MLSKWKSENKSSLKNLLLTDNHTRNLQTFLNNKKLLPTKGAVFFYVSLVTNYLSLRASACGCVAISLHTRWALHSNAPTKCLSCRTCCGIFCLNHRLNWFYWFSLIFFLPVFARHLWCRSNLFFKLPVMLNLFQHLLSDSINAVPTMSVMPHLMRHLFSEPQIKLI